MNMLQVVDRVNDRSFVFTQWLSELSHGPGLANTKSSRSASDAGSIDCLFSLADDDCLVGQCTFRPICFQLFTDG